MRDLGRLPVAAAAAPVVRWMVDGATVATRRPMTPGDDDTRMTLY